MTENLNERELWELGRIMNRAKVRIERTVQGSNVVAVDCQDEPDARRAMELVRAQGRTVERRGDTRFVAWRPA